MAPDDQTVVVLELPCHPGSADWDRPHAALQTDALDLLKSQNLIEEDDTVVASDHHAVPFAYPILEVGTRAKVERLQTYLDRFENLHRLGRSADFTYTHVHNLYAQARTLTKQLSVQAETAP